ncbi:hypothetical protein [Streptomonospora litoralis]|uniref:Uncharacterized protein n=1 Tax=Streptomonospora litoralis TaxID=2498135 RepID=A0A4P6QB28_9ACTN|nr:hypothetical protein [Streptomonospora litoralis]QBI56859.1 hypothetical protein EKD16_25595 [Streptomonospora litoralis]
MQHTYSTTYTRAHRDLEYDAHSVISAYLALADGHTPTSTSAIDRIEQITARLRTEIQAARDAGHRIDAPHSPEDMDADHDHYQAFVDHDCPCPHHGHPDAVDDVAAERDKLRAALAGLLGDPDECRERYTTSALRRMAGLAPA